MKSSWATVLVASLLTPLAVAANSLSYNPNKPAISFDYSVNAVDKTNWVALYKGSNSPTSSKYSYSAWVFAPDARGTAYINAASLDEGDYNAWLLAKNGYDVLDGPVKVHASKQAFVSSISFRPNDTPLTFDYKTQVPDDTNWIAVYPPGTTDPDNESYLAWIYAKGTSGTVTVPSKALMPGDYDAFFLGKNKYKPIAEKLTVTFKGDTGPVKFMVHDLTTKTARQGDAFQVLVAGLINPRTEVPSFTITKQSSNAAWLSVSPDGVLSGTAACSSGNATVVVKATLKDGTNDSINVNIPCIAKGKPLVPKFRFLSMNLWVGGSQINDYHCKQLRVLTELNVDVVAFSETAQTAGQRLAKALGWTVHYSGDTAVLSRYPVTAMNGTGVSTVASVSFDKGSEIIVHSAHLGYDPYGPYDFCQSHMTQEQVFKREEESGRTPQIKDIIANMQSQLANKAPVPVFLAGDFNAPSHLDWTDATKNTHCGVGYTPWPTSKIPTDAGLIDSFRQLYPDALKYPANTWSPIHPAPAEPQDRLDFIYYAGRVKPVASEPIVFGKPNVAPNTADNEWPTDHAAFITDFVF